jgi:hypothetical protein
MNLGRPIGPRARWLLRPTGWPTVVVALLALIAMLAVTRPPLGAPSIVAARYWLQPRLWKTGESLVTWRDWTYTIGLVLGIAGTAVWLIRTILRDAVIVLWRQDRKQDRHRRGRFIVAVGAVVTFWATVLFGWPLQVGQHWLTLQIAEKPDRWGNIRKIPCPSRLSEGKELLALQAAATDLPTARQRVEAVKLLVEKHGMRSLPALIETVGREKDNGVRADELRLIGLIRDPQNVSLFESYLGHSDSQTRSAAMDGLGMIYGMTYPLAFNEESWPTYGGLASAPPIDLANLLLDPAYLQIPKFRRPPLETQDLYRRTVRSGQTVAEREAAARAMLPFPPNGYQLRVAEWGVWVADGGDLKLVDAQLDEIPAFVHRTANPLPTFEDRINDVGMVFKPVIHIAASDLMAVDLQVMMRAGRPWFCYPMPDDFTARTDEESWGDGHPFRNDKNEALSILENERLGSMSDLREGYPWIEPHHRFVGPVAGPMRKTELTGIGLRWQSLIVSPRRLEWMTPPQIPTDPKYAWWERLRQVPASWISSRGESERFLYYDGPTLAKTPVDAELAGYKLHLTPRPLPAEGWLPTVQGRSPRTGLGQRTEPAMYPLADPATPTPPRRGLFIHVSGGVVTGQQADAPYSDTVVTISRSAPLKGPEVKARFEEMLQDAGLTAAEAAGMTACWSAQFFGKDGRRFLLFLSAADYDALFPMAVRPPPTERARVGVVLTEFKS